MGVAEELPEEFLRPLIERPPGLSRRLADSARRVKSGLGLLVNNLLLERRIRAFMARIDEALSESASAIADLPLDALAERCRRSAPKGKHGR